MVRLLSLVLLVPSLLSAQASSDTTPRPIALDEAVRLAQRNSPLSVQARGDLRVARAGIRSAWFAFVPNVGVSLGSDWRRPGGGQRIGAGGNLITVTSTSYSSGLNAQLDLFDGGRRFFDLRAARSLHSAADASDVLQEFQVALDVKQQYFDVLAAREAEEAASAQLAEAQQQLRVSTVRVAAGAASRSDSLRSVVAVGNAQLAILDAQNRVQLANASLTRLVGTSFPVTAVRDDSPDAAIVALDEDRLLQLAVEGPDVGRAEAQLGAARAGARSARSIYLPTLSASFFRGGNGFDRAFGFREPFRYASVFQLTLSLPLLDQLQREERVVRANVDQDNAEALLRDARLRAQQELTQSLGLLRNAGQRVDVQLASVAATEEDLRFQQQRYALGAATLLDVLTSQAALNEARNALITARFDQRVARARLEALIGRPLVDAR